MLICKSTSGSVKGQHLARLAECVPILSHEGEFALECKFTVVAGPRRGYPVFVTVPAEKKSFRELAKCLSPKGALRKGLRVEGRKLIGATCILSVGDSRTM